jgi:hypothetical protein
MKKELRKTGLLEGLLMVVVALGLTALKGFVLFSIWGWFAIPLGAVAVPIGAFIGASCAYWIFTLSTQDIRDNNVEGADESWDLVATSASYTLILWLLAYLAYIVF